MPRFSVIIPIYNSEEHLTACLESLKNQSYEDFEIVMVNDGSKDNSGTICKNFSATDEKFKLYEQQNAGVSVARNKGIDSASGEWLTFVDSDDWVDKDYLKNANSIIEQDSGIQAVCNLKIIINESEPMCWKLPENTDATGIQANLINNRVPNSMWCYFIRREIIGDLRVDKAIHHYEDMDFLVNCFSAGVKVFYNDDVTACYHYRQGSYTHTRFTEKTVSGFRIVDKYKEKGIIDQKLLGTLFAKMIFSVSMIATKDSGHDKKLDKTLKRRAAEFKRHFKDTNISGREKLIISLLALNPPLFYKLYKFGHKEKVQ